MRIGDDHDLRDEVGGCAKDRRRLLLRRDRDDAAQSGQAHRDDSLHHQNLNCRLVTRRRIGFARVGRPNCGLPTIV